MSQKKSLVKQSSTIKKVLKERLDKLGLKYTQVVVEAERFGQNNIKVETLSRYFSGSVSNALTEESIIFLAYRYGISITLLVGTPTIVDGKLSVVIPPYDEKIALSKTIKLFGKPKA